MSTQDTQKLIQKAAQATAAAAQSMGVVAQQYATLVNGAMESAPFAVETEALFQTWRATARLSQESTMVDTRMQELTRQALAGLVSGTAHSQDESAAKPLTLGRRKLLFNVVAKDAPVKLAKDPKVAKAQKVAKTSTRTAEPVDAAEPADATQVAAPQKSKPLMGNSVKLLTYLKTVLGTAQLEPLSQTVVAKAAGIPHGSITASLARLKGEGYLKEGATRGTYRLTPKALK